MDFVEASVTKQGNSYHVSHGSDENLYVEFENEAVKQNFESEKEGRPIFKDKVFINITFPGDKTKKVRRPITDQDKMRFARQWEMFQRTGHVETVGMPVEQWAPLTKSEAAEFKAMNIHTVEALAGLPDTALTWLGARNWRDKAKVWLDNANGGASVSKLHAENESLRADIEALKVQIKEISTIRSKKEKTDG